MFETLIVGLVAVLVPPAEPSENRSAVQPPNRIVCTIRTLTADPDIDPGFAKPVKREVDPAMARPSGCSSDAPAPKARQ
jgi:hypothetical protein